MFYKTTMLAAAVAVAVSAGAARADTVLECDLPGFGTPGVYIGFGSAWHGLLDIDKSWDVDDYAFGKTFDSGRLVISRVSGAITQTKNGYGRTGSCHVLSKDQRRF